MHASNLELKLFPSHLKYVFLDVDQTLPVIIANNLTYIQEGEMIRVLKDNMTTWLDHC